MILTILTQFQPVIVIFLGSYLFGQKDVDDFIEGDKYF